jgi:hypothetical protein
MFKFHSTHGAHTALMGPIQHSWGPYNHQFNGHRTFSLSVKRQGIETNRSLRSTAPKHSGTEKFPPLQESYPDPPACIIVTIVTELPTCDLT